MTNFLQVVSFDPLLIENTTPGTVPGPTGPQGPPGPPGTGGSGAGLPSNIVSQSAAYTAAANDFVEATTTSAGFTVTLPASPAAGALVAVKKVSSDTNTVTIVPAGGGTIDGDANATTVTQWAGAIFEHKGSNVWRVAASMTTSGPAGPAGAAGPSGAAGAAGTNGAISLIQDEGSALTVRPTINFVGAGVTATDDSGNSRTLVTILGGGGAANAKGSAGYAQLKSRTTNVTISSTTFAAVDTAMDVTVTAAAGDLVMLATGGGPGDNNAPNIMFDVVTMVSGTATNFISSGNGTALANGLQQSGWLILGGSWAGFSGTYLYTVQAGDVVAGAVTFRLMARVQTATSRIIQGTNSIFAFWGRNFQ